MSFSDCSLCSLCRNLKGEICKKIVGKTAPVIDLNKNPICSQFKARIAFKEENGMNETQAKKLAEELAKRYTSVSFETSDGINYEVTVFGGELAVPPSRSCDLCKNRIICLVNKNLMSIAPILATATLDMKLIHDIMKLIGKDCKRFQR